MKSNSRTEKWHLLWRMLESLNKSWVMNLECFWAICSLQQHSKWTSFSLVGTDGYESIQTVVWLIVSNCTWNCHRCRNYCSNSGTFFSYSINGSRMFDQWHQGTGESEAQFLAALRKLSEHCQFGQTLSDALSDQLVSENAMTRSRGSYWL